MSLKKYFDSRFESLSFYQPCPSTFSSQFFKKKRKTFDKKLPIIAVNLPFDRAELRHYSNNLSEMMISTIGNLHRLYRVIWVSHIDYDIKFEKKLKSKKRNIEAVRLNGKRSDEILDFYSSVDIVIGGRAHSVMIPIGLGKPVIGLSSHNKITWFFDDLNGQFPCFDINNPELSEEIYSALEEIVSKYQLYSIKAKRISKEFFKISVKNKRQLYKVIKGSKKTFEINCRLANIMKGYPS